MDFNISNEELIAKMKQICEGGFKKIAGVPLSRDDCYAVLEFLLTAIADDPALKFDKGKEKKLNLRILNSGFSFLALSRMERSISWLFNNRRLLDVETARLTAPSLARHAVAWCAIASMPRIVPNRSQFTKPNHLESGFQI